MYNQYYNNMGYSFPKHGFNWSNILTNTQKTLGIINQALPIVYQVRPLLNNARTLFKIAGAINEKDDTKEETINYNQNLNNNISNDANNSYEIEKDSYGPKFFL